MIKQWIYRNGEKPFSVTEIEMTNGSVQFVSVSLSDGIKTHYSYHALLIAHDKEIAYDLIPYEPYSDFKIDDEVYVWDVKDGFKIAAHWSGLNENGQPTVFIYGRTSFTGEASERWNFCEKANKEDK